VVRFSTDAGDFRFAHVIRPAHLQLITDALSMGYSGQGLKLTTLFHVALRLRMHVARALPNACSWSTAYL